MTNGKGSKHTVECNRRQSARMLGKLLPEETKAKLRGKDNRPFPPHCIKCINRDISICAQYNKTCFEARKTDCVKRLGRRKEHPDYQKAGEV